MSEVCTCDPVCMEGCSECVHVSLCVEECNEGTHVNMCVWRDVLSVHMWICVCVWRHQVNVGYFPQLLPTLFFEPGLFVLAKLDAQ